jgi:hypothetical protein
MARASKIIFERVLKWLGIFLISGWKSDRLVIRDAISCSCRLILAARKTLIVGSGMLLYKLWRISCDETCPLFQFYCQGHLKNLSYHLSQGVYMGRFTIRHINKWFRPAAMGNYREEANWLMKQATTKVLLKGDFHFQ